MYEQDLNKPKLSKEERDKLMKDFLDKGGKIEKLKPGLAYRIGFLDNTRTPRLNKQDLKDE